MLRLRRIASSLLLTLGCLASGTHADEIVEFDVRGGQEEEVLAGMLSTGFVVTCRFAIDRTNTTSRRPPWIGLWFQSGESRKVTPDDIERVKLTVYRQGSSNFFGEPIRWHYVLLVGGPGVRDHFETLATANGRESVHTLSLALLSRLQALALIGDDKEEPNVIDIPPFDLKIWRVVVSGLKGRAYCADNSDDPNGMENSSG